MSEELQNGEVAPEVNGTAETENPNVGSELATDSGGQHEQEPKVDEAEAKAAAAQQATQDAINKKHFQAKQAERERDDALAKVAKFEQDKRDAEAVQAGNIPPIPDEFDDDFQTKMAERDAALVRKAQFEASQATFAAQQQANQQAVQQQAQAEFQKAQVNYLNRSVELGIDQAEMQAAGNAVVSYGLSEQLLTHIVADKDGPLITKHLAANPSDAITLAGMSPYDQGAYLSQIKAKAEALKPKQSTTPPPVESLTGGVAQTEPERFPNSAGSTFD